MARRVLRVSAELLAQLCRGLTDGPPRYFRVVEDALPADVRVEGVGYSAFRPNEVQVVLESPSFRDDEDLAVITPVLEAVTAERGGHGPVIESAAHQE